jgi:hypothetical protein
MSAHKVQLNAELPADLAEQVRGDARRENKSLEGVIEQVFRYFYVMKLEERRRWIRRAPNKRMGRKF